MIHGTPCLPVTASAGWSIGRAGYYTIALSPTKAAQSEAFRRLAEHITAQMGRAWARRESLRSEPPAPPT